MRPRKLASSVTCFSKLHGHFIILSTHGRVYPKWGLPRIDHRTSKMNATLQQFHDGIQVILEQTVDSDRRPWPHPCESALFPSAACSYTNSVDSACSGCTERSVLRQSALWILNNEIESPENDQIEVLQRYSSLDGDKINSSPSNTLPSTHPIPASDYSQSSSDDSSTDPSTKFHSPVVEPAEDVREYTKLQCGKRIWKQLTSAAQSLFAGTPNLQLILTSDELSEPTSQDILQSISIEWLDQPQDQVDDGYHSVDVRSLEVDAHVTVDLGERTSPRQLYARNGNFVRPCGEAEYRASKSLIIPAEMYFPARSRHYRTSLSRTFCRCAI